MALIAVQQRRQQPQEQDDSIDPIQAILTGLQVAQGVFGIRSDHQRFQTLADQQKLAQIQQEQAPALLAQQTEQSAADLAKTRAQTAKVQAETPTAEQMAQQTGFKEREVSTKEQLAALKQQEIDLKKNELLNKNAPISFQDKVAKMGAEERKRVELTLDGLKAIRDMRAALEKGVNTFSLVGDNEFTIARRSWNEAFGRVQSGGAINETEVKNFTAMAPGAMDSAKIQQDKLNRAADSMLLRAEVNGITRDEIAKLIGKGVSSVAAQSIGKPAAPVAASIQAPASSKLSKDDQALVGLFAKQHNIAPDVAEVILRQRKEIK